MKSVPKRLWIVLVLVCFAGILKATLPPIIVGSWTATSSLTQARSNGSAVLLSNGRILFTGGDSGGVPVQSAEYFAADGTVSSAAAMNYPRSSHFAVVLSDGSVLVGGGNSSGGGTTNSAEIYDPSSDSWSKTGTMAEARANATAALLQDGRVVIAGGDNAGAPSNTIEIYYPSSGSFSVVSQTLISSRTKHAMAVLQDGRVLIAGGFDANNPLASSDIFDPSSDNVSAGPNLATARYSASATTLLNGQVAVIGGAGSDGNGGTTDLASIEIFNPDTNAFHAAGASLATAREGHQAYLLPNNNNVLITGGTAGGTALASAELFTAQASAADGSWSYAVSATGAMTTARAGVSGSANQKNGPTSDVTPRPGLVIVGGGTDASGATLASTEAYGYPTVQSDKGDYPPGTAVKITGSGFQPNENVTISLVESPLFDTHGPYTVTADGNGNISDSSFITDAHDENIRFFLSAVGSQSGAVAQNSFTDANPNTLTIATANPLSISTSGGQTTYGITETFNGNNTTQCKVDLTAVSTGSPALPPGTTFSLNPSTLTSLGPDQTSTLTITAPAGITANTYSFTVTSTPESGSCQQNPKTLTSTGTLVVHGPAAQVRVETAADGSGTVVPAQNVTAGNSVTAFAIERDSGARFIANVPATWSLQNKTGGVIDGDLVASGDGKNATFTGHLAGSAQIKAVDGAFTGTSGTLTVLSGAATQLAFTVEPGGATTGTAFTTQPVVSVEDVGGNVITTGTGSGATITLSITSATGTSGAALTCTGGLSKVSAAGVATFAGCKIDKAGTNYQLHAVASGLTPTDSTQFDVINAISKLGFTTGPFTGAINQCLGPITVQTQNTGGAGTNPSAPVQADLSIISGGSGAFFSDAACGTAITNVSIPTSANSANFFFKGTSSGSPVVQAADHAGVLTLVTQTEAINKRTTTTAITLTPSTVTVGQPSTVAVTVTDSDTAPQSNPQGTIALVSSEATDVFGTCTLAPSGGNAATCSTTVTPAHLGTSPHGITATFTPTDTIHSGSSNSPAASLTVNKADQTITFAALTNKTYGDAPFTVSATGGASGNAVTFTAGAAAVCTASGTNGSTITITGAGTCTVTAHQVGNSDYNAATDVPQSFTVSPATPSVTVTDPMPTFDGNPHTATAVAKGVGGVTVSGTFSFTYDGSATAPTNAKTSYAVVATFTSTDTNYTGAAGNGTLTIKQATPVVTVTDPMPTYDGNPHMATATAKGVGGVTVSGSFSFTYDGSATAPTNAKTSYAVVATFTSADTNYTGATGNGTLTIKQATPVVTVTDPMPTFDGNPHTATAVAKGVGGVTVSGSFSFTYDGSATAPTNAKTSYAVVATFTSTDTNYTDASGNGTLTIKQATPVVTVTDPMPTFDGNPHTATAVAKGVGGVTVSGTFSFTYDGSATAPTNAKTSYAVVATFASTDTNYTDATGNGTLTIKQATPLVTVTDPTPTYDGNPHTATAVAKGVGGVTVSGTFSFTYDGSATAPTDAKTSYAVVATFTSTDTNYTGATGNGTLTIKQATPLVTVTDPMPTYDGNPHMATAVAKGIGGVTVSGTFSFTYDGSATAPTNAKTSYAVVATFTSTDTNYTGATGNGTLTIKQATPLVTVTDPMPTYDGNPHTSTAVATGVGGAAVSGSFSLTYDGSATAPTNAKTSYAAVATFTSTDTNYTGATGNGTLTIKQAPSTTTITPSAVNVIYNGAAHGVTATVTGAGGLNQSVPVTYTPGGSTAPVNPGTYAANASYAGDVNHLPSSATQVSITIAFNTTCSAGPGDAILPPINNDGTSVYKRQGGSTIPVKFRVCDAAGNAISNASLVFAPNVGSVSMLNAARGTVDNVNETPYVDVADSGFRWDSSGQQWIFNMATTNLTSGNTYQFRINLTNSTQSIIFVVGVK